jgi:hypothetical protein
MCGSSLIRPCRLHLARPDPANIWLFSNNNSGVFGQEMVSDMFHDMVTWGMSDSGIFIEHLGG